MSRDNDIPFDEEQSQSPAPLIPPERQTCPECRGEMVEGWVPDLVEHSTASAKITSWHPGPPHVIPGLFHTKYIQPPNLKEAIPIRAFRCVRCGFLKFYARVAG